MVPAQIEVISRYSARQAARDLVDLARRRILNTVNLALNWEDAVLVLPRMGARCSIPPDICGAGGIELRPWQTRRRPHDALPVEVRRRW